MKCLNESALLKQAQDFSTSVVFPSLIFFEGDLGAGKSTFCRQLIQTLVQDPNLIVPSPTFTLVQEYECPRGMIYHFDLYRLNHPNELIELNFEECLNTGLCLIEWPDRAPSLKPMWRIFIEKTSDTERALTYHLGE
ncbi:MAG: hypothetical protein CNLJKLNK_00925 [Holosporales bacterium]